MARNSSEQLRAAEEASIVPEAAPVFRSLETMEAGELKNAVRLLEAAGSMGRFRASQILERLGITTDDASLDGVYERALRDARDRLDILEVDAKREVLERSIWEHYLTPVEQQELARGEREPVTVEAQRLRSWLIGLDVEQAHLNQAYFAAMFGGEPGYTQLDLIRGGAEAKRIFIDRVIQEKTARVRTIEEAFYSLGIGRNAGGELRLHGADRPQEVGVPIHPIMAHALATGFEHANWLTDPKERSKALGNVYRDAYALLGRMPDYLVDPNDIINTADAVRPRVEPPPLPVEAALEGTRASPEMQTAFDAWRNQARVPEVTYPPASQEMQSAFEGWQQKRERAGQELQSATDRGVAEQELQTAKDREAAKVTAMEAKQRIQADIDRGIAEAEAERAPKPSAPDIVFDEPVIIESPEIAPRPLSAEAVRTVREAYTTQHEVTPEGRGRWTWITDRAKGVMAATVAEISHLGRAVRNVGWLKERAKGVATAGVLELSHFFRYGRAARREATVIDDTYKQLCEQDVGITPDQLNGRIERVVDDAEERLMKRLIDYRDEFGNMALDKERLDVFKDDLRERLRSLHSDRQQVDRRQLRDTILKTFDPGWFRRGRYGVMELALAASGLQILINKTLLAPSELPASKVVPAPKGDVTIGPIEIIRPVALPPPDVMPMTQNIWQTLHHAYPGATDQQLIEAAKEVLRQNHFYEPAWTDTVRYIEQIGDAAARSTRALVEGTPIKGILSEAVQQIMGVAPGAVGV
ncbi:MAG: hypothetical protein V1723_04665 [Candidatus Uhrbacteria bacterium]